MTTQNNLTQTQFAALARFKDAHGHYWESLLRASWHTGVYGPQVSNDDIATLQRMRNTLGSRALQLFARQEN